MGPQNGGNWTMSEKGMLKNPGACFLPEKKPLRERPWALKACRLQQNQAQLTKNVFPRLGVIFQLIFDHLEQILQRI